MYEDILGASIDRLTKYQQVALMMSGGVDSTILYYALHKLSINIGFDLVLYTVENSVGYEDNVSRIRWYLSSKDNQREVWVHALSSQGIHNGNIDLPIRNVLMSGKHDLVYTGTTKNPPFPIDNSPVRMTQEQTNRIPRLACPFADHTKDYVFSLYQKYGLMELYELTHSCTRQKTGECGLCFQCIEKRWSEQQNNYVRLS
jgi:hypothetical protein